MVNKPTLLAVSSELPWPLNTGGRLRTFHLLRGLGQDFEVHLVAPTPRPDPAAIAALKDFGTLAVPVPVPRSNPAKEITKVVRSAVRGVPYVLYGRHEHDAVRQRIRDLRRQLEPSVFYCDHLDAST